MYVNSLECHIPRILQWCPLPSSSRPPAHDSIGFVPGSGVGTVPMYSAPPLRPLLTCWSRFPLHVLVFWFTETRGLGLCFFDPDPSQLYMAHS